MTEHVKVLQHHIEEGICMDAHLCMVAKALQEHFPAATHVSVSFSEAVVYFADNIYGEKWHYTDWRLVGCKMMNFDRANKVRPFEFDMERGGAHLLHAIAALAEPADEG